MSPSCEAAMPVSQACRYIEEHLSIDTATLGKETLLNAAKTAMSSKIVDSESDFFAHMVVDAVQVGSFMQVDLTVCYVCHDQCLAIHCYLCLVSGDCLQIRLFVS